MRLGAETTRMETHAVTLSFDDGFRRSFLEVAEIYESHGLRACLNVVATNCLPAGDPGGLTRPEIGSWDDWNELKARGHEVMPHTYDHQNLTLVPFADACELIDRCTESFEAHLIGFDVADAVYNFAYNASTPELEQYALRTYGAVRTQGSSPVNPMPIAGSRPVIGCWSDGPGNSEDMLMMSLKSFLEGPGGWFVWNTHGLDDEGWGPIRGSFLDNLLRELRTIDFVWVVPAGELLKAGVG